MKFSFLHDRKNHSNRAMDKVAEERKKPKPPEQRVSWKRVIMEKDTMRAKKSKDKQKRLEEEKGR